MASIISLPGFTPQNLPLRSVTRIQWVSSDAQNTAKMMSSHLWYWVIKRQWFILLPPTLLYRPPPPPVIFLSCPRGRVHYKNLMFPASSQQVPHDSHGHKGEMRALRVRLRTVHSSQPSHCHPMRQPNQRHSALRNCEVIHDCSMSLLWPALESDMMSWLCSSRSPLAWACTANLSPSWLPSHY